MASVFKPKGQKKYTVQWTDEHGRRRKRTGFTDKLATMQLGAKLEREASERRLGLRDAEAETIADAITRPINEHIEAWKADQQARGLSAARIRSNTAFVRKVLGEMGVKCLRDIGPDKAQQALAFFKSQGSSAETLNCYITGCKTFLNWLERRGMIGKNPLKHVTRYNTAADRRWVRRALTDDEVAQLLTSTRTQPKRGKCSGVVRADFYKTMLFTGLRWNEAQTLCVGDVDLTNQTLTVQAANSKHKQEDRLPIAGELVETLRGYVERKKPGERVFDQVGAYGAMLVAYRKDLAAAGIPFETSAGRADLHALRHTFITRLVKSGCNTKVAQTLARHADPKLTLGVYTHLQLVDQQSALDSLPALPEAQVQSPGQELEAVELTGTDGSKTGSTFGSICFTQGSNNKQDLATNQDLEGFCNPNENSTMNSEKQQVATGGKSCVKGGVVQFM